MIDIKRLAQRLKLHKIEGTVVHHCAILVKILRADEIEARIIHGYAITPGEICEHYWVRVEPEGLDLDIGWRWPACTPRSCLKCASSLQRSFPRV